MTNGTDDLKLCKQLCFPLYEAAKEAVKQYHPLLKQLDLTYTQYITMLVLWEKKEITVKDLGERLYLDSGTLTPLLKKLEGKGYQNRSRHAEDERIVMVTVTPEGQALKRQCATLPEKMGACMKLTDDEAKELYRLLYKLLNTLKG